MNILQVLHREEKKLLQAYGKIEGQLRGVRAAINAIGTNGNHKKHTMSAAARRKISMAQRARWAKQKDKK
jgi:hypothetical protein